MSEHVTQNSTVDFEPPLSPRQLWRAVRKSWPMVVSTTAMLALLATFYTLGQTKIYRAAATIQIDPNPPKPLGRDVQTVVDMGTGAYWSNKEYYETQFKVIQSRRVAEEVVRTLGLQHDSSFLRNVPTGKVPPLEASVEASAEALRSRTLVEPVKNSRLVVVSLEDADPVRAQRIVTALVTAYVDMNVDDVVASTNSAADWLRGQLDRLKGELEDRELALHQYKTDKNILSLSIDDQSNMLREEMKQLSESLTQVRARQEHLGAQVEALQGIDPSDPANLPATELIQDHLLQSLRSEYVQAKREREGLVGEGKGTSHPAVQAADGRLEATRDALLAEVRNIQGATNRDFDAVKREGAGLSRLLEGARKRAFELNLLEIDYNKLLRTKNNTEKLYALVLDRTKESDLTRMMKFNNIRVVDSALIPRIPVRPRVPMTIALGTLTGLLLGLGLALGRELLDRSLKAPDDIERELSTAFLGLLPMVQASRFAGSYAAKRQQRKRREHSAKGQPELVVHDEPTSGIAEAARAIRTNILFMAPDNPFRRLLVTSAGPADGKTTVACCIAIAMAQAGQRVVLIDCDLRRPRVHRIFGQSNDAGVTTALLDRATTDTATRRTDIPNLSILPSGPHAPNPAELLQSEAFARLLEDLQERFDRIIIDSPPIVPVTDATIISRRVDGTVVVVRAFKTTRDLARRAVRALRDVDGRIVGTVLNAVDLDRRGYDYYQYYYYKRYGYGVEGAGDLRSAAIEGGQS